METQQSFILKEVISVKEQCSYSDFVCSANYNGNLVAAKFIKYSKKGNFYFNNELAALRKFRNCEHIVRLINAFDLENYSYHVIITDLHLSNLENSINELGSIDEETASIIMYQILSGLNCLHLENVAHQNLIPPNILISNQGDFHPDVYLTGLSCAINVNPKIPFQQIGDPRFWAPELFEEGTPYTQPADIWSVGLIMFFILTGRVPFQENSEMVSQIKQRINREFLDQFEMSEDAKDLILWMMNRNPIDRPSAYQALRHRWFDGYVPDWKKHIKSMDSIEDDDYFAN